MQNIKNTIIFSLMLSLCLGISSCSTLGGSGTTIDTNKVILGTAIGIGVAALAAMAVNASHHHSHQTRENIINSCP